MITGGLNDVPARLTTTLDPVRLSKDVGVAMRSISYGEVFNVVDPDNLLKFTITTEVVITRNDTSRSTRMAKPKVYKIVDLDRGDSIEYGDIADRSWKASIAIPENFYHKTEELTQLIVTSVNNFLEEFGFDIRCILVNKPTYSHMYIEVPGGLVMDPESPIFKLLNMNYSENALIFKKESLPVKSDVFFVYFDIVQESYINRHKSRLLAIFPCESKSGGSFYEFKTLVYMPIEVRQFSEIKIELRNMRGELVKIKPDRDTIISLHMAKLEAYK